MAKKRTPQQPQAGAIERDPNQIKKDPPSERGAGLSVHSSTVHTASYSGPILPQQLEAYERSELGTAYARALIKQAEHRMELEKIVIKGDDRRANIGQWMAFAIAIIFCFVGAGVAIAGHEVAGGAIAGTSVLGLVTAFINGATQRRLERIEKAKIMAKIESGATSPKSIE